MQNKDFRIERDSLGELRVPADALYGAQTQRAVDNFPISGLRMPPAFIQAAALIKAGCAVANQANGQLESDLADAVRQAALEVARGRHGEQFPVDVFQTGSGTSTNMNVNEVLAHLATRRLGRPVHPNDHVNRGQSSNDVIPAAIHVSASLALHREALPALDELARTIAQRVAECQGIVKTGRTHLMDALPVTLGQELGGWAAQVRDAEARLRDTLPRLLALPLGGTAVGTGVNAPPGFGADVARWLAQETGVDFRPMDNLFVGLSSQDTAVELSGQLRGAAVVLMKIANDLRWMNSGPLAGLGEIALPALQPGSSIMPGKVNPVIPEAVAMAAAQIMGNDATVAVAGQSGNFQLNVMLPVTAYNLLQSIELLAHAAQVLARQAIAGFTVNQARLEEALSRNPILVTALNNVIGYERGAEIAKRAYREGRPVIEVAAEMTDLSREELADLLDPRRLVGGSE
ncbi:class II fumarate hydratase [Ectothiorhodospiraceae bacterium 2226]|nr:class II fumarate hydratase [Ectothiorhodospiraceae bacterium 2226]